MRGEYRLETKSLRSLRAKQLIALHRTGNAPTACSLERVGDGEAGKGTFMRLETVDDAGDEGCINEWPRRVVDQNRGGRLLGQRLEPCAHRVLPSRAPRDDRTQPRGEGPARGLVERHVIGANDDEDVINPRMRCKCANGALKHRNPANRAILLRPAAFACGAGASTRRHA